MVERGDLTQPIRGSSGEEPKHKSISSAEEPIFADRTQPLTRPVPGAMPKIPGVNMTRMIGEGGMGVVYLGTQTFLHREVAVKVLRPEHRGSELTARFQGEARTLAEMKHRNIVGCYQADVTSDGDCYLEMEYIDGPNLREWIEKNGHLPLQAALILCREMAEALQHALEVGIQRRKSGIIHRDVKPDNVLLERKENVAPNDPFPFIAKLADLGLARAITADSNRIRLTQQGTVIGTPATMAPEQFDDPDNIDFRADIYGLGCVLFHALTGQPAFQGATMSAILSQKLQPLGPDPRKSKPALPKGVSDLVMRMLARKREQRPATYSALIAECNRLIAASPAEIGSPKRLGIMLGAIGALVLVASGAWLVWGRSRSPQPSEIAPLPIEPLTKTHEEVTPLPIEPKHTEPIAPSFSVLLSWDPKSPAEEQVVTLAAILDKKTSNQVSYAWKQIDGPIVELLNANEAQAHFRAPQHTQHYDLSFQLTATRDDGVKDIKIIDVPINAKDDPPVASIKSPPKSVKMGDKVVLEGQGQDPEGRKDLQYSWKILKGNPQIALSGDKEAKASFIAPEADEPYVVDVELIVSAGQSASTPAKWSIDVNADSAGWALPANERLELFPAEREGFPLHWQAPTPPDTFTPNNEEETHCVRGLTPPEEFGSRAYELPLGSWKLEGNFRVSQLKKIAIPKEAGIMFEFGSSEAVALRLVQKDSKFLIDVSRLNRAKPGAEWTVSEALSKNSSDRAWPLEDLLIFAVRWDGKELEIEHVNPTSPEILASVAISSRPKRLLLSVRGKQAFFKDFVLQGL